MRISRLTLTNYRCFEHLELELDETTVLVGANDTGKSTVLEALYATFRGKTDGTWWEDVVRDEAEDASGAEPATASAIVDLEDFTADEEARLRSVLAATEGRIRLGISSLTGDRACLVLPMDRLEELVARFDKERCQEWFDTQDPASVAESIFEHGDAYVLGDDAWITPDVWELADPDGLIGGFANEGVQPIRLGGRTDSAWSPEAVVEPILAALTYDRQLTDGDLADIFGRGGSASPFPEQDDDSVAEALGRLDPTASVATLISTIRQALNAATGRMTGALSRAHSAALADAGSENQVEWSVHLGGERLTRALLDSLHGMISRRGDEIHARPVAALGPGAKRTLAIAALDLYRDAEFWPLGGASFGPTLALLLVEEPETGLHPGAQRALAKKLATWATHGLQIISVTHSPAFVNAVPTGSIRLAKRTPSASTCTVARPAGLEEIRSELGVQPSDVLLARRYVIVEGDSDRLILDAWARRLGVDLRASGVQLVPAGGSSLADQVARFLWLAYEGAEFFVVLDNGKDTAKVQLEMDQRFGGKVVTRLLSRTEVEGFFVAGAIEGWLRLRGVLADDLGDQIASAIARNPSRVRALNSLAEHYLARPYQKAEDGFAIASLTTERAIDPEIQGLIVELQAD